MYFHLEYSNNKILNARKIIFKIFNYQDVTHNMCKNYMEGTQWETITKYNKYGKIIEHTIYNTILSIFLKKGIKNNYIVSLV